MVEYCFKWNQANGVPGEPLTAAAARARHDAGEEYTAVMPPRPGAKYPTLVTSVWKTGVVVIAFLDDFGRRSTEYTFMRRPGERLFLVRVSMWAYPTSDPGLRLSDSSVYETLQYREDGSVKQVIKNKIDRVQESVDHGDVPIASNWEPVPAFGDYASIARFERHAPVANRND